MSKLLRTFITFIAAIILLALVALIGVVVFVNPNDLKPQINQAVTKFTGRNLELAGNIQWSIFPWLGLQLNDAKLSNNPGFTDKPFAQIQQLDIQVRLLPLLHKQLEVGKLQINGLTLHLIKNPKGRNNWEEPLNSSHKPSGNDYEDSLVNNFKPTGFIITGLSIRDGHIFFEDQKKNNHIEISKLQLKTANLAVNKNSAFDIRFDLKADSPNINATVKLLTNMRVSEDGKNIVLDNLNLNSLLKGSNYPKGELPFILKTNANLNLNDETITANQLTAIINQIKLTGHFIGQQLLSNPSFRGTLNSKQIEVGKLSFQQIQLAFLLKNKLLSLKPITAQFYQGSYQGDTTIDFNPKLPRITTHHQVNHINTQLLFQSLIRKKSQLQLAGLGNVDVNLTTQGNTTDALIKNINGQGQFNLDQGAIKGINLSYWIALGKALLKHEVGPKVSNSETPFDKFTGSFTIKQGLVNNNDLVINSGRLRVSGKGTVDLPKQYINYELDAQPILLDGSPDGMAIPIKLTGSLQNISISPILSQLSVEFMKEKLKGKWGDTLKNLDLKKIFH